MNSKYKYCPHCSAELVIATVEGHNLKLCIRDGCKFVHWNNPIPVAVTIIPRRHRVALVKRRLDPRKGLWCPPCGFINEGESPSNGAKRETLEESLLNVQVKELPFKIACPQEVNEHVSFFLATSFSGELGYGDDAEGCGWFSIDDLPEMAFSTHHEVLMTWFNRPTVRLWRALALLAAKFGIKL